MNATIHTLTAFRSAILSTRDMDERDRLCSAWRIAAQDVADDLLHVRQYMKTIAERHEMLAPKWRRHSRAHVKHARRYLPWRLSLYLEHVKAVSIAEQRMTEAGIAFAKSSDAWEN